MPATRHTSPERDEPLIRDRGDACPGALRLHRADDGFLARLRLPGGRLTERQVEVLAAAAEDLGDGGVSITSRGNAELRGLAEDCAAALAERLAPVGLLPAPSHERVRNLVASPAAGLDGLGHADAQLWVRELDALLCAEPRAAALSGRFLFVLDDGRGDVAGLGGDVTLLAAEEPGAALLRVGARTLRIAAADAPRAALAAALAFLAAAEVAGNGAWRVRELPAGTETGLVAALTAAGVPAEPVPDTHPDTHPDAHPDTHPDTHPPAAPPLPPGHLGAHALHVLAPLGRLTAAQLRGLLPAAEVRFTPWRGAVVVPHPHPHPHPDAGPENRAAALTALAGLGLLTDPGAPGVGVTACTGRPGCGKALDDVRAVAAGTGPVTGPLIALPVHFSGCERRCGHPHGAWVDVLALGDGAYQVDGAPTPYDPDPDPSFEAFFETVAAARVPHTR
ncbi:cobalamin biosynthesis protein CobG [Streptomyces sp. NPDC090025]|uniref:cobalamin biosynthesis protein CobG n=1 Tax=Streptomyces sp. NPDC090025 TaxID=3365922 RepID=UPI003834D61F